MEPTKTLTFKHATLTDNGQPRPVEVVRSKIFTWFGGAKGSLTHIVSDGGAIVPVLETVKEVSDMYQSQKVSEVTEKYNQPITEKDNKNGV